MTMSEEPQRVTASVLQHYGIKGMKWGVRRNQQAAPAQAYTRSADSRRAVSLHTKARQGGSRALSNKEMQDLVNRMNLEQQFAKLQGPKKETFQDKAIKAGQTWVRNMAKDAAMQFGPDFLAKKNPALGAAANQIKDMVENAQKNAKKK